VREVCFFITKFIVEYWNIYKLYIIFNHIMASVEVSKLSQQEIAQLSCTYAALILHDDGQDITADKLSTLIKAAGVKV
jgi:hypothetical protein